MHSCPDIYNGTNETFFLPSEFKHILNYFIFIVGKKNNKLVFGIFLELLNPSQKLKPYLPILFAWSPKV